MSYTATMENENENGSESDALLARIEFNPAVMVGKPVIRGTRLPVALMLELLALGVTMAEILEDYPHITEADVRACFAFARRAIEDIRAAPASAS